MSRFCVCFRAPLLRPGELGLPACATVLLLMELFASPAAALEDIPIDYGIRGDARTALGIAETFGRWDDSVQLLYDPDDAPARFADDARVVTLIEQAVSQWEGVSGIRFVIAGVDRNAPADEDLAGNDGLVRIAWGAAQGAAGLAGPSPGAYEPDLGYFPYEDGSMELNWDDALWSSDLELVGVLVHELGHLLGLGHSDNPDSVMFANPYNHLQYPRADDIRVMQALYGPPAVAIDPATPLAQWQYTVPPLAGSAVTQYLFKPNQQVASAAWLALKSNPSVTLAAVSASTPDGDYVRLNSGGVGNWDNTQAIDIAATLVLVDPAGYVYEKTPWPLTCPAGNACSGFVSFISTEVIKTVPGTWQILVVDESAGTASAVTLLALSLPVTTAPAFNQAPTATVSVAAGAAPNSARFTIDVADAEGDAITVIWHPPGASDRDGDNIIDIDVRNALQSGGAAMQSFAFGLTGTHTFFVELVDDGPRYAGDTGISSASGDGFQTLLKLTVTVPVSNPATALTVVSTTAGAQGASPPSSAVLAAVGNAQVMDTVWSSAAVPFPVSAAGFSLGASANSGVSARSSFTPGETVVIAGAVRPLAADVDRAGEVYIVVRSMTASGDVWRMRDLDGQYPPWNTQLGSLQPAYESGSLAASSAWEIYTGTLAAGDHRIFIGYRTANSSVLHFTAVPMQLLVN